MTTPQLGSSKYERFLPAKVCSLPQRGLLILVLTASAATALGQGPRVEPSKPKTALSSSNQIQAPQLTKEDLAAFLDGLMPLQLEENDIAGAVVCVVKDGKILFEKGYGYSNMKDRTPVTADATLFRAGSISKTFVWTAVMQMVEQGKIDLDRDVNDYLDFKLPASFGKPITMREVMTHTTGLEENLKDLFLDSAEDMEPTQRYLLTHLPKQIYPPGTTPAYSNYASTLAAYIVELHSGLPYNAYVERNILHPLDMSSTTFEQPLPPYLQKLMSYGYSQASKPPKNFEFVQVWPAGSVSTTAENMAHFMIAHLQGGEYKGVRILKPETARLMHSRAFGIRSELNGMAYGFYEETRNGHRIIGHGGDTQWFHSDMHLMLDDHIGFFVSYNSLGKKGPPREALWEHFLDRYFPFSPLPGEHVKRAVEDANEIRGTYWSSRRTERTPAAILGLLTQPHVQTNSDGTITVDLLTDYADNPKRFEEIAPLLFREVHGQDHFGFTRDHAGRLIMALDVGIAVLQPVPTVKNGKINLIILVYSLSVFVLSLLSWPFNAALRKHYGYKAELTAEYRRSRLLLRIACVINLAFVGYWFHLFTSLREKFSAFSSRSVGMFHVVQIIGSVGVLALLLAIYFCVRSWADRPLWKWTKVWNSLLMLAFAGYAFFVLNWGLLDFRFGG